jgi:hypothetical protein
MRRSFSLCTIVAVLAVAPASAAAPPSVAAIVARMEAARSGLTSYRVPVTMSGSVRNGLISVHFTMKGTEYFKAPDRDALRMTQVPKMASGFKNTIVSIPPPAAWPEIYTMRVSGSETYGSDRVFILTGTPRKGGNVTSVTMLVNSSTYALDTISYAYKNGSNLGFQLQHGNNPYRLPVGAAVSAHFPSYRGTANVVYGAYTTNVPIPESVFEPGQ